jgi:DNA-binding CsgD family transcriptional regulator
VAQALHVTRNTAKTHLKNIFEKTGTKRQAELVRLLLRSAATVSGRH